MAKNEKIFDYAYAAKRCDDVVRLAEAGDVTDVMNLGQQLSGLIRATEKIQERVSALEDERGVKNRKPATPRASARASKRQPRG